VKARIVPDNPFTCPPSLAVNPENQKYPKLKSHSIEKIQKAVNVKPQEVATVVLSFVYFFCLLCSYYILRPVRDEMGVLGGIENLQWLFTGTFIVMLLVVPLFGAAAARFPRRTLLPGVYLFFIANILLFAVLVKIAPSARAIPYAFFIWVSVFNLFVVSVFWSFMADIFSNQQAKRLFAVIAAGGSAGAICGPLLTAFLAQRLGIGNLLFMSAGFLLIATVCVTVLGRLATNGEPQNQAAALGGKAWEGLQNVLKSPYLLGICVYIFLFTTLSTFLYFMQAELVRDAFESSERRTAVFATIDLAVNALTIILQLFVTSRLITRFGLPVTLALIPGLLILGFIGLGLLPTLVVLVAIQVTRRAGNYAITKPAREILFTVVKREDKYKSKSFIDTVVYRGGDALSGWLYAGLAALGLGLAGIAGIGAGLAIIWLIVGVKLGQRHDGLAQRIQPATVSSALTE